MSVSTTRCLTGQRVHGVDLGVRSLTISSSGGKITQIEVPKRDRYVELRMLSRRISDVLCNDDDVVFIEEPPLAGSRNVRTLISLAQVSSVIMASSQAHCYFVEVARWKKDVIGMGNASKYLVSEWVEKNDPEFFATNQSVRKGDQNSLDARCIEIYGHQVMDKLSCVNDPTEHGGLLP